MNTLKIQNFQSHTDSTLEFIPNGINVIVGETDSGKSAIIRSLELLAQNRPAGDKYRTHNTSLTTVEWKGVKRVKSNTLNQYELDGTEYRALRASVPRQVTDKLRLSPINFRSQHDAYFLLNESPGAVARAMNDLADLGLIDYTSAELKSLQRDNNARVKTKVAEISTKESELSSLAWASDADKDLSNIQALESMLETLMASSMALSAIVAQTVELVQKLDSYPDLSTSQVDKAVSDLSDTRLHELTFFIVNLEDTETKLSNYPEFDATKLSEVCISISDNRLEELTTLIDKLEEYDTDLRLCPDPADDITRIASHHLPDYYELETLIQQLEGLNARQFPSQDWIKDIEEIEMKLNELSELGRRGVESGEILQKWIALVEAVEAAAMTEEAALHAFEQLLIKAKRCPLCNGDCSHER